MDIRKTLLKQYTKQNIIKLIDYLIINEPQLKELISIYKLGPYRLTQKAAWVLGVLGERNASILTPYLPDIISFTAKSQNVAVKRNTMRLLQFVDIPPRFQTKVLEMGFHYLNDSTETIAVKVFSMSVIGKIAEKQPELARELRIIIEDQLPYAGPAFISRARKVLKRLTDIEIKKS